MASSPTHRASKPSMRRSASTRTALGLLALLVTALVAGCDSGDSSPSGASGDGEGFELRIGAIMPFTGDLSSFGPSIDAAVGMAVKDVEAALKADGLADKYSVTLVDSEDDQTKVPPAIEAATKLVTVDKVNVIVGTMSSGSTIAVAQTVTIPQGVLLVAPTPSSPAIPTLEDNDLVFQIQPPDTFQAAELVQVTADRLGTDALINVGWRNDDWGEAMSPLFLKLWKENGGRVGTAVSWNPEAANFNTEAQKLAGGNPDGWVVMDFPQTFAKIGPALVRTGAWSPKKTSVTAAMRDATALGQIGAPATEGLGGVSPSTGASPLQESFTAKFKERAAGKPVTGFEGFGYDAVVVPALAALKADSSDPSEIAAQMQSVTSPPGKRYTYRDLPAAIKAVRAGKDIDFDGVSSPLNLDDSGATSAGKFDMWQFQDGKARTLKSFDLSSLSG